MTVARRRKPFSRAEKWQAGWFAVARGMCSGPWDTEGEAQRVVDVWNAATTGNPDRMT